jgi:hypothetical protein
VINSGILKPGRFTPSGGVRAFSTDSDDSRGQIIITGDYTQTADGALNIEIAGNDSLTGFDQLVVSKTATLGGTLNVVFTNGFYPLPNSSFEFLSSSNRNGAFASFNYPSNDLGLALTSTASHLTLQVINTRPVIPPIADQTITNFSTLRLAVNATDDDLPAQTLTYALTNSPAAATVDGSGVITWRPFAFRTPLTASITVLVTDDGIPNLTSSRVFQVVVVDAGVAPVISLQPGTRGTHSITLIFAGILVRPCDQYRRFGWHLVSS